MFNDRASRVLGRTGARELSTEEVSAVAGGQAHANVCTIGTHGQLDGDGHCH